MIIKDVVQGYFVLRDLKRRGYVEDDGLSLKQFIELVFNAERNVRKMEVENNEDKQS